MVVRMLARKLPFYALTFVIAITIDFFIPRLMPGNALDAVLAKAGSQMGSPQALHALEKLYGIDNPAGLPTQYAQFWESLAHGNLGISTSSYPTPVTSVIATALPWTVALVGAATVISFVLGTGIGILVAWRRGTWLDSLLPVTTFFQAAPYFFLAFLAIELFAVKLGWFPYGLGQNQLDYQTGLAPGHVADVLDHAALPALTIVVASAAGWMVGMRNQMLTTMDEDYVLIAQAKGLPKQKVIWYAARNAILPSVSGFSLAIGFVVSGALLTEIVFSYPGIGFVLGTGIGILVAWRRGTWLDSLLPVTTFFQAAPYFFLAFLAIELFAVKLGWFPYGLGQNQLDYQSGLAPGHIADLLDHAALPALTIVVASAAGWMVGMRNQMLTTMDEDYVLIAQAKGLPKQKVIWYAARNAILPSVSGFSLAIGFVVSGALLTEIVFSYPGIGFVLYQAVINHDAPLMQGIFLIITLAVLAANLIADFAYLILDPRTRQEA